jgi:type VI secretion system secreted protein Hcp
VLDSVSSGTQLEYFIRFQGSGISSEWLELDSFSMGLSNSGGIVFGGGGGAGKASAQEVFSVLGSSKALVELTKALAAGQHLQNVEIEAYHRPGVGEDSRLVDQYYFEDVLMSSLQTSGNASSTVNSLGFDFAKFNHGHVDYKADGSAVLPASEAGFDFAANKGFTGGPPVAGDATGSPQDEEALSTGVDLKYYVTFDGAPGWLELDSFSMGLSNSGGLVFGGGGGAGKVTASGVALALGSSAQILELTDGVTSGKHFKDLEVEAYQPVSGNDPQLVDQYYFQDVLVSTLQSSGANHNQVSVDFARFSHGHVEYQADGSAGDTTSAGWDFLTNKAFTAPVDSDLF